MQPERWAVPGVLHVTSTSFGAGMLNPAWLPQSRARHALAGHMLGRVPALHDKLLSCLSGRPACAARAPLAPASSRAVTVCFDDRSVWQAYLQCLVERRFWLLEDVWKRGGWTSVLLFVQGPCTTHAAQGPHTLTARLAEWYQLWHCSATASPRPAWPSITDS